MLIYRDLFLEWVDEDVLLLVLSCLGLTASRSIGLRYSGSSRSCAEALQTHIFIILPVSAVVIIQVSPPLHWPKSLNNLAPRLSHSIKSPPAKTSHLSVSVCISGQKVETRARNRRWRGGVCHRWGRGSWYQSGGSRYTGEGRRECGRVRYLGCYRQCYPSGQKEGEKAQEGMLIC